MKEVHIFAFIFHYLELRLMLIGNTVRNWEVWSDYEPVRNGFMFGVELDNL